MTWHNQIVILKQQIQQLGAVIGSGLIQIIKPVVMTINNALSGIIKFTQNVVNALGKIFGWQMELKNAGISMDDADIDTSGLDNVDTKADDAGDSLDKATESAKKFKDQLQGFDKLNVLRTTQTNDTSTTPSSGKNNTGANANTGQGAEANVGEVQSALKKTRGLFESEIDNLYELGEYIGNSLTKALASIDWQKVYQGARNFGKGLAQFLNGLISPELFSAIGKTIAGSLNTAFHFLDSFGETFDWADFGKSIGVGLTTFLNTIDWGVALSASYNWGKGVATALNNFLANTSFEAIGKTVANLINVAVKNALAYGTTFNFSLLGVKMATAVNSALKNVNWNDITSAVHEWATGLARTINAFLYKTDFKEVGATLARTLNKIVQFAFDFITTFDATKFGTAIGDTINGFFETFDFTKLAHTLDVWIDKLQVALFAAAKNIDWNLVFTRLKEFFDEVDIDTLILVFGAIAYTLSGHKLTPIVIGKSFLKYVFGGKAIVDLGTLWIEIKKIAMSPAGGALMGTPGFDVIAGDLVESFWNWFYKLLPTGWQEGYSEFDKGVKEGIANIMGKIGDTLTDLFDITGLSDAQERMKENFKKGGIYVVQGILDGITSFSPAGQLRGYLTYFFGDIWDGFCSIFGISSPAEKMKPIGQYIVEGVLAGFKLPNFTETFTWLKTTIGDKWKGIKNWWKNNSTLNKIKTSVEDFKTKVKDRWGKTQSYWKSKNPLAQVKTTYESIKGKVSGKWNETQSFWRGKSKLAQVKTTYESFRTKVSGAWDKVQSFWRSKSPLKKVTFTIANLAKSVRNAWETAKSYVSSHSNLGKMKIGLKYPKISLDINYRTVLGHSIPIPNLSWYWKSFASGGFLDKYKSFTMASIGENGIPEILGQVGGRPAVAGGAEITGIRESVEATGYEQVSLLRRQNQILMQILNKEFGISKDEIFSAVKSKNADYINRTGKSAFAT